MDSCSSFFPPSLPAPPSRIFLIGIGGIGMSGLAQLLRHQGHAVAGSDRQFEGAGKDDLFAKLRCQGIDLFAQDGLGLRAWGPAAVVVSAAVESSNPDLVSAHGLPVLHRARALSSALSRIPCVQVAVAGSCGKTSVTGWLASALRSVGRSVLMVNGGLTNEFETAVFPGNFHCDASPEFSVYEVDESDRSLTQFTPDVGVLLNIGADHYGRAELVEVFGEFLARCRSAVVLSAGIAAELGSFGPAVRRTFAGVGAGAADVSACDYASASDGIAFRTAAHGRVSTGQFGVHSAANGAAVLAALDLLAPELSARERGASLRRFRGVRQRFELMGATSSGVPVVNDYAHNADKIGAAIRTGRESSGGPLLVVFQPHGFGPLAFMRDALGATLRSVLLPGDRFVMLPVFYAGGTTSFSPTSAEVASAYASSGLPVTAVADRSAAGSLVQAARPGTTALVLVVGGRDPSLRTWSASLTVE